MAVTIAGCGINPAVVKSNPPHFQLPLNGSLGRYSSFVLVPATAPFLSSQLLLYSHKNLTTTENQLSGIISSWAHLLIIKIFFLHLILKINPMFKLNIQPFVWHSKCFHGSKTITKRFWSSVSPSALSNQELLLITGWCIISCVIIIYGVFMLQSLLFQHDSNCLCNSSTSCRTY